MLALMGVFDFVGTIVLGLALRPLRQSRAAVCYYGLRGLSLIYLPGSSFSIYGLSLFSAFYGLDWVATVPPTVRLSAQAFGRERAGVAFGWIFASHMARRRRSAAYFAGYTRSELADLFAGVLCRGRACLVAAVAVWLIESPRRDAIRAPVVARAAEITR